ncbi:MAG: winged helix-turn-helix transcriptional regulator [Candidatus Bathyarchaeia archaeon]
MSTVAKELQLPEGTVRDRLERMRRTGFLRGLTIIVNPSLLDMKVALLWIELPSGSSKELIQKLKLMPEIVFIVSRFGGSLTAFLGCEDKDGLDKKIELLRVISGAEGMVYVDVKFPECRVNLSRLDWEILRVVQRDPSKLYREIAEELRISSKTVKRRLERMIEVQALFTYPDINFKALEGAMSVDLLVLYDGPELQRSAQEAIRTHLDEHMTFELVGDSYGFFTLIVKTVYKVQEILERVRSQPGVRRPLMGLVLERIDTISELMEKQIEKKLRHQQPS